MKFIPVVLVLGYTVWGFAFPPDSQAPIALDGDQVVLEDSTSRTNAFSWGKVQVPQLISQPDEVESNEDSTIYDILKSYPGSASACDNYTRQLTSIQFLQTT
jgi:hypothetical protein